MMKADKKIILVYIAILMINIASCIIRYPNFETTLWSASDTNYQCLMNAKAMLEADKGTASFLPLITFSEDTDYGLEYSSGAFDKETGQYFYYISFPSFPFIALVLFLKITGLAVNESSLYMFCSILFCISVLVVVQLFITIFSEKLGKYFVAFMTGITYMFSFEIMHSLGLTYWGQNWYMIIFPLLSMSFLKITRLNKISFKNYFALVFLSFLLLQTEWSGYFVLFALAVISLIMYIREHEKKYLYLVILMVCVTVISAVMFVVLRVKVVGFNDFFSVIMQRTAGRSRISDYTVLAVEKSLLYSFGNIILLIAACIVWLIIYSVKNKAKIFVNTSYVSILVLMSIPLLENHIFTNHALTYSMDRMKWYFILNFILLSIISRLIDLKKAKIIICYTTAIVMTCSLFLYIFVESDYRWNDERMRASWELAKFINENYDNNVLGQLGSNSVWGYSKMMFGHGIENKTSVNNLIKRAEQLHKRYAVALNDLELAYTQKWYSSAVIYDLSKRKYIITGSLSNQFCEKIDELEYLLTVDYVDIYVNGYDNYVQKLLFPKNSTIEEKKKLLNQAAGQYDLRQDIVYFIAKADIIPSLIMVDNQNVGVWTAGVSVSENRLIFLNTNGNRELLRNAIKFSSNGTNANIDRIFTVGDFIYVDINTENIADYSYPNTISISYEED